MNSAARYKIRRFYDAFGLLATRPDPGSLVLFDFVPQPARVNHKNFTPHSKSRLMLLLMLMLVVVADADTDAAVAAPCKLFMKCWS